MTIFEIDKTIENYFMSHIDEESGEFNGTVEEFENLQMQREDKIDNIAMVGKELKAEIDALKAEEDKIKARRQARENNLARIKELLKMTLKGEKFKSIKNSIYYSNTKLVEVDDISLLPKEYLKYKDPEADKATIKKVLESGIKVEGARLVENSSVVIR